jgi:hypothetical protein
MMGRAGHPSHDDLAAHALGALDPDEEREVAGHVAKCRRCAAETRDRLAPVVAVLAESVEQVEPPPGLRTRLMAEVAQDADAARSAAGRPSARATRERAGWRGMLLRPAAGLAALAVAGAGVAGYLIADDSDGESVSTFAVASELPDAGGTLEVENDSATLRVHSMPALVKGAVYQVWVAEGHVVRPSASFVPHDDGTATAAVPEAATGADEVMVTREPRPGKRSPTLPPVLSVRID